MHLPQTGCLRDDPRLWDLFTRAEEYESSLRDVDGRFPYYASRDRDVFVPAASEYLVEHGYRPDYPDDSPFAVCLSHDIDYVDLPAREIVIAALRHPGRCSAGTAGREVVRLLRGRRRGRTPTWIADLEEEYGAKSTFFAMAEDPGEPGYAYDVVALEAELGAVLDRGCGVGLHGGLTTCLDAGEMARKRARLERVVGRPVAGYRNHNLRFRVPGTWRRLEEAGFSYDSTLGYADCAGFRNGMCHPFRPVDRATSREIGIVELPLHLMDVTLGPAHMRLSDAERWEAARMLLDRVEACGGVLTVLWHTTSMDGDDRRLYERILSHARDRGAWLGPAEELLASPG